MQLKEEGNRHFQLQDYKAAAKSYSQALKLTKDKALLATLYRNRAACGLRTVWGRAGGEGCRGATLHPPPHPTSAAPHPCPSPLISAPQMGDSASFPRPTPPGDRNSCRGKSASWELVSCGGLVMCCSLAPCSQLWEAAAAVTSMPQVRIKVQDSVTCPQSPGSRACSQTQVYPLPKLIHFSMPGMGPSPGS